MDPRLLQGLTPEEAALARQQANSPDGRKMPEFRGAPGMPPLTTHPRTQGYANSFGAFQDPSGVNQPQPFETSGKGPMPMGVDVAKFAGGAPAAGRPNTAATELRRVENTYPPSATRGITPATAPPVITGVPTTTAQDPFLPYESKNPESMYDGDIEFTHTLSRMLGMAGLGDKAAATRDLHMKLQQGRMDEVGKEAQRAFVAGDVTKGIDMLNHMVPNGQKITSYRKNPDGSFAFQMQDGKVETRNAQQMVETLTMLRNPDMLGAMITMRAKTAAEAQGKVGLEMVKNQLNMQKALNQGLINGANQQALERLKQAGEKPSVFQQIGGETYVTTAGGKVFKEVMIMDPLTKKPTKQFVPAQLPGMGTVNAGGAAPASQGLKIDQSAIPIALQYR